MGYLIGTWRGVFLRGGIVNTAFLQYGRCPVPSAGPLVEETSGV